MIWLAVGVVLWLFVVVLALALCRAAGRRNS